jgi:hypothetical protein
MNCYFCQTNLDDLRQRGLSRPAGSYHCLHCGTSNKLSKVVVTIDIYEKPLEATIWIDHTYYFRVDYYLDKTYLVGPRGGKEQGYNSTLLVLDGTAVTPKTAKNKMKTYLIFL